MFVVQPHVVSVPSRSFLTFSFAISLSIAVFFKPPFLPLTLRLSCLWTVLFMPSFSAHSASHILCCLRTTFSSCLGPSLLSAFSFFHIPSLGFASSCLFLYFLNLDRNSSERSSDVGFDLICLNDDRSPSGHIVRPTHVNVSQSCFHSLNKTLKPNYCPSHVANWS